jgi:hypothetical protein
MADAADLRRLHSDPGAHEAANRGEIATARSPDASATPS